MIKREIYLNRILTYIDKSLIKVNGRFWKDNIKGINHLHIADFLLLKEF